jgi:hypothetical protein
MAPAPDVGRSPVFLAEPAALAVQRGGRGFDLAVTLGAGGSIFAVVHGVLLTPPPLRDPAALVVLHEVPIGDAATPRRASYATFEAWQRRMGSHATLEALDATNRTVTGLGVPERLSLNDVTAGFLANLGVLPARGRTFTSDDVGRRVALVSHAFWRVKLGGDTHATVRLRSRARRRVAAAVAGPPIR